MPCWLNYPRAICKYTKFSRFVKPPQRLFFASCGLLCKSLQDAIPRKLTRLQGNRASLGLHLSPDQLKILDQASQIEPGLPYAMYEKEFVRAIAYGRLRDQILA
jgi:hypothetical protein